MQNQDKKPPLVEEWYDNEKLAERYRAAGFIVESESEPTAGYDGLAASPTIDFIFSSRHRKL